MLRTSFSFFHRGPLREHIKSGARHCSVLLVSLMGPCGAVAFGGKRNAGEFQHRRLQVDTMQRQVGRVKDFLMWGLIKILGQYKENIVIQTQNGPIILINPHMTTLETDERESRNTA